MERCFLLNNIIFVVVVVVSAAAAAAAAAAVVVMCPQKVKLSGINLRDDTIKCVYHKSL